MSLTFKYRDLWFVIVYVVMLAALAALPSSPGDGLDLIKCPIYLAIAVSAVTVHLTGQRSNNWLRPDILFLVGFFVVHYQWLTMALVSGLFPENTNFLFPMEAHATYGAWLSTIALISWLSGYAVANPDSHIRIERIANNQMILNIAIVVLVAFAVTVGPSYFTAELYRTVQMNFFQTVSGVAAYLLTITEIFTLILVSLFFYPRIINRLNIVQNDASLALVRSFEGISKQMLMFYFGAYILVFLLAAERGQVIQILSAIGVVYAMNFRSVRLIELVMLIGLAALVFTGIGIARSIEEELTLALIFNDAGYWSLTRNMANSSITLYQGIDLVHSGKGFFYGQLWLSQILGLVPFLQSTFLAFTSLKLEDINSATQITAYILGSNPHTGFGTSFVIDIYLNFGVPGILFFSFLYGYICKVVLTWVTGTSGFVRFFVAIAFVSLLFYVSRSSLFIQLRTVVWGVVIIMLFVSIRRQR
ncbi:MAG: O-antigen polysaccharide polymerase Wzy [Nitrosomonadaceae bacterium]|nr:O-antigen polysaccharide polymerase Wzy [Nitrosomonadaceae bacterium]